ncbi:alpha-amylase family protein [Dermabacter sp. HSID17554]|uniref:alpha-amylase family protein n=1 Tax=Dermabacter sp. HSID17554 TaxID=2419511 RepID=UPI001EE7F8C2|nr:alpha-amylase family protein [Dermabacter sp. HSID17554]
MALFGRKKHSQPAPSPESTHAKEERVQGAQASDPQPTTPPAAEVTPQGAPPETAPAPRTQLPPEKRQTHAAPLPAHERGPVAPQPLATSEHTSDRHLTTSFDLRLARYGGDLRRGLSMIYGERANETFERVLGIIAKAMVERSEDLRTLDEQRLLSPDWLQDPRQLAYVAYADRFAENLRGVEQHLDYLETLGVTHLHLMPLLEPREGNSDGGYAVKDYGKVRADLGTMDDLESLASALHKKGMSLELDLVLNHVAKEHEWAQRARAGEEKYLNYFLTFPDRTEPDEWERSLPEIFPDFAPGNFTFDETLQRWVWTTFNDFQWDLNWANPDVFCEFVEIVCTLANRGVDLLRLDAIAFTWKKKGTDSQNLPEVHFLTRALRAAARIAAPALAIKAEAIVGPQDLVGYLGVGEHAGKLSDMAYHNSYMVQLWSALASRDTTLLRVALAKFPPKPANTTWGSYVRCHDDIGWAVTDADAADAGLDGFAHRAFLSEFYSGTFPGSFAEGLVFQHNPTTGDKRISGSLASLAGLEKALKSGRESDIALAIDRITLLHAAMLGFGGQPLLYMGDELGMLNDPHWASDPAHADDNRWVHRPRMDWDLAREALAQVDEGQGSSASAELGSGSASHPTPAAAQVLSRFVHLVSVRKGLPQLHASVSSTAVAAPDARLLVLHRDHPLSEMLEVFNMSEYPVPLDPTFLREFVGSTPREAIAGVEWDLDVDQVMIQPYATLWFLGPERTAPQK